MTPAGARLAVAARPGGIFDARAAAVSAAALAPFALAGALSGQELWWRAAVVAMSALIACERSGLAPLGVALHGAAISAGILGLTAALAHPPLFVGLSALLAGCSVLVTARGAKLRSLGSFTFIPALYVACETAEGAAPGQFVHRGLGVLPYAAAAVAPALVVSAMRHARARAAGTRRLAHLRRLSRWTDHGAPQQAFEAAAEAMLGVAGAAALVSWQGIPHGQWVIWSAASVIVGEVAAVRRKMWDRAAGALLGVPLGTGLGTLLPPSPAVQGTAAVAALLTLVAFRSYRLAFGLRCACVSLALMAAHHATRVAAERAENILLGGLIGLGAFAAVRAAGHRFRPERAAAPSAAMGS